MFLIFNKSYFFIERIVLFIVLPLLKQGTTTEIKGELGIFILTIGPYFTPSCNCFFNYNEGLESRFAWRFSTQNYTPQELRDIFIKKIKDVGWKTRNDISVKWFEKNYSLFKSQGRDIETLFAKTKIAHSRRVFCKPIHYKTMINEKDLDGGLRLYKSNGEKSKPENNYKHMYV